MKRLIVFTLLALAVAYATPAEASTAKGSVLNPAAPLNRLAYRVATAKWWQWALSIPADRSPIVDETGANCGVGQRGPVWFLAGAGDGQARRTCVLPAGKAVLIPIINFEWSRTEALANGGKCFVPAAVEGTSYLALASCAKAQADRVTDISAKFDGAMVVSASSPGGRLHTPYRIRSLPFSVDPAEGNPFALPPGRTPAAAEGFWLMLAPLSPGHHTLHIRGSADFSDQGFVFTQDVRYELLVTHEHGR